jgi:hypothetical protein
MFVESRARGGRFRILRPARTAGFQPALIVCRLETGGPEAAHLRFG